LDSIKTSQFSVMLHQLFRMASTVVCTSTLITKESHKGTEFSRTWSELEVRSQGLTL